MAQLAMGMAAVSGVLSISAGMEQRRGMQISASASRTQGARTRVEKEFEAKQLEVNAGQVIAAAQRDAIEVQRNVDLLESRAKAVAAASGGTISDPGIVSQIARMSSLGAYQKALAYYKGEDQARSFRIEASAKRYEGILAEEMGNLQGEAYEKAGSAAELAGYAGALGGASSFMGKYGK